MLVAFTVEGVFDNLDRVPAYVQGSSGVAGHSGNISTGELNGVWVHNITGHTAQARLDDHHELRMPVGAARKYDPGKTY